MANNRKKDIRNPRDDNKQNRDNKKKDFTGGKGGRNKNTIWIFVAIAVGFILIQYIAMNDSAIKIDSIRFEKMIKSRDVKKLVVINKDKVEVFLKESSLGNEEYSDLPESPGFMSAGDPQYYFQVGPIETFLEDINKLQEGYSTEERISINYENRTDFMRELWSWVLPFAIIIAIWIFIFRRMGGGGGGGGGLFNIGKSRAKLFEQEQSKVKTDFSNVAGLEEAKVEIAEIVDFLKKPDKYTKLGGKIPKGALLIGPPGTGKTLLARAVAGEAKVPFFALSGSDFVEMFVGVGASRVRDLFGQAKTKAPCIVFIDEIDAIGRTRSKGFSMGANDERENTLNQLLTEMDGFDTNTGVIILAATNRADILDPALLRAGRFDRQIHVELPDLTEREEIFKVHIKPIKIDESLDIADLAKQTPGFSGADIANVCNEAALIAARHNKKTVMKQDFLDAVDRIIGGLEKKSKIITKTEKKTIAFHEAGHATISWMLEHAHPLIKVTIVPRGQALGAAWYKPHERQITTKEQLLDELCSTLGGRASEEINLGKISTGALNDLERVSKQAYSMIAFLGFNEEVGNVSFFDSTGRSEYSFQKPYSEKTGELIDQEVKKLIEDQYVRAKQIISENKTGITELAELLIKNEVIFSEDLEKIFGKRKFNDEYEEEINKVRQRNKERLKIQEEKKLKEEEEERKLFEESEFENNNSENNNDSE